MAEMMLFSSSIERKHHYRVEMQAAAKHGCRHATLHSLFQEGPKYSRRFLLAVVHCAVVNRNIDFLEELLDLQKAIVVTNIEACALFQDLWRTTKTFPVRANLAMAVWMLGRAWPLESCDPLVASMMLHVSIDGMNPDLQVSLLKFGIQSYGPQFVRCDKWFKQCLQRWATARKEHRYRDLVEVEIGGDEDLDWRNFIRCYEVVNKEHVRCWVKSGPHVPDERALTKPRTVYYECGACVKTNGYARPRTDYGRVVEHMTRHRAHPYLFTEGFCDSDK